VDRVVPKLARRFAEVGFQRLATPVHGGGPGGIDHEIDGRRKLGPRPLAKVDIRNPLDPAVFLEEPVIEELGPAIVGDALPVRVPEGASRFVLRSPDVDWVVQEKVDRPKFVLAHFLLQKVRQSPREDRGVAGVQRQTKRLWCPFNSTDPGVVKAASVEPLKLLGDRKRLSKLLQPLSLR